MTYRKLQPLKTSKLTTSSSRQTEESKDGLVNKTVNKILDDMKGLKEQNTIIDSISQQCSCSLINQWQKVCEGLS